MKKFIIAYNIAFLSVLIGLVGGIFLHPIFFLLAPVGFVTAFVSSIVASFIFATKIDDLFKKTSKSAEEGDRG